MDIPVLPVQVGRRAIYRNAAVEGVSVYQTGKRGAAAVDEMERLIEEILK
jgi:chromosome partitioning protein